MMPELDWDALTSICNHVRDVPTISSISLTCRTLRAVAAKRLLETHVVVLTDTRSIMSFHKFVNADRATRLPFVRRLRIDVLPGRIDEGTREEAVQSLLDLLQQATHLKSLVLPRPESTYRALGSEPRFLGAISHLSTLRELALERRWAPNEEIVSNTPSRLRTLRVSLAILSDSDAWFLEPVHLYSLLERIAPTLEVLEVLDRPVAFDNRGINSVVFPAIRSFRVVAVSHMTPVWTEDLVQMFPVLDGTLAFEGLHCPYKEAHRRVRELNRTSQLQKTWKSLDRVIGHVNVICMLGLSCPARHLMLDGICGHSKGQLGDALATILPTHVKLSVDLSHGMHIFEGLLPPEVAPRLTHLVLFLSFCDYKSMLIDDDDLVDMKTAQWPAFLAEVMAALNGTRLTHLRIVLRCSITLDNWPSGSTPYSKDFLTAIRNVGEGPEGSASELMGAFPTLQYVFLTTTGDLNNDWVPHDASPPPFGPEEHASLVRQGQWLSSSGWRSVSGTPERLASDVEELLIEANDLILTEGDHVSETLQDTP
ncbi:hypothetical protein ONZ51_g2302 [Trametes cubensis]|uniref:Uncharacterized protein n=1 Tax=Trametes cubensis TaxID=1111947 RepID=A0AAD7XE09_9APHY|nr:hypothetical protein ONZ51_g2302 [Trametes cubensis]